MASVLRTDIKLAGELAPWLYHPDGATGGVVLGHGLSAVRDQRLPAYRPGRRATEIACPLLICVCDQDSLVDAKAADKVAHDAPQGEVAHYPIGLFDIYTGEWFERAVSRQAEFFVRHLTTPA